MDEIFYIVGIDARPWKKAPAVDAVIPLALFFVSIEAYRHKININTPVQDFNRYFLIVLLVVLSKYLGGWVWQLEREEYAKRLLTNMIYLGIISTGFYNALTSFNGVNKWLVYQESMINSFADNLPQPYGDDVRFIICTTVICAVGTLYIWLRTSLRRRAEFARLAHRPSSHTFRNFHAKEGYALIILYAAYFFGSLCVISFLTIA
jgi:hypothetical protein